MGGHVSGQRVLTDGFGQALSAGLRDAGTQEDRLAQVLQTTGDFARMDGADYRSEAFQAPWTGGADWAANAAASRALNPVFTGAMQQDAMPGGNSAQGSFRQGEIAMQNGAGSVAGIGYVAQRGDSISRILGTSNPQNIGNFMRANGLGSSNLNAGQNYFVPADGGSYGDSTALGQAVLNSDNAKIAQLAAANAMTAERAVAIYNSYGGQSSETSGRRQMLQESGAVGGENLRGCTWSRLRLKRG